MQVELRLFKTSPNIAWLDGYSVNVLLDLGNVYGLTRGHNKLYKAEIQCFYEVCLTNIAKFPISSQEVYKKDLDFLMKSVESFTSEKIAFGELSRTFFRLKSGLVNGSSVEEKYLHSITKNFGKDSRELILDADAYIDKLKSLRCGSKSYTFKN